MVLGVDVIRGGGGGGYPLFDPFSVFFPVFNGKNVFFSLECEVLPICRSKYIEGAERQVLLRTSSYSLWPKQDSPEKNYR